VAEIEKSNKKTEELENPTKNYSNVERSRNMKNNLHKRIAKGKWGSGGQISSSYKLRIKYL